MNSFNHYAYGAIGEWIVRVMGGLEIDEKAPGYKHILIEPRIGGNLSFAELQYQSVLGEIGIGWEVETLKGKNSCTDAAETVTVKIKIPVNTTAAIRLEGSEMIECDRLIFRKTAQGLEAEAGSGNYTLKYRK